jgi:hypothetical protein
MAQELFMQASLLSQTEKEFQAIENGISGRKLMSDLYSKQLTEYSVCVHVLSNRLECKEGLLSFGICAVLTRVVLNMPKACLNTILDKCDVARVLGIPSRHEFELRMMEGVKQGDLGILFYLLCCALPRRNYTSHSTVMLGVVSALEKLGLTMDMLAVEGGLEAAALADGLSRSKIDSVRHIAEAGFSNFKKLGYKRSEIDFYALNLPPALLEDFTSAKIFSSASNSLADFDLDKSYEELVSGQEWVERFSEACL